MKYLISFILIFLISCSANRIYNDSIEWIYKVENSESEYVDSLSLSFADNYFSGIYPKVKWYFESKENESLTLVFSAESAVTDNSDKIRIYPPVGAYLDFTELLPYPEVNFPIRTGDTYTSNHIVRSHNKMFGGREVNGTLSITGKVLYRDKLLSDSCWVIEGNNSIDNYSSKYYFHDRLGFVYFSYKDDSNSVEINLESLRFIIEY